VKVGAALDPEQARVANMRPPEAPMPQALDPEQQHIKSMKCRLAALRRHAALRDPLTGKSTLAQEAGRKGGQRTASKLGCPAAWGLAMALKRWHKIPIDGKPYAAPKHGGTSLRFKILTRDAFRCQYCGRGAPAVLLQVDHVIPVSRGGRTTPDNLVTACRDCNLGKSNSILDRTV
jgi:hypothetical protein